MTEDYLHYIYKHSLYSQQDLQTVGGDSIQIIAKGNHNQKASRDFLETDFMIVDILQADSIGTRRVGMDQVYFNLDKLPHQDRVAYEHGILNELRPIL